MRKLIVLVASLTALSPATLAAQDGAPALRPPEGQSTQSRMLQLAGILGSLQYVRALCQTSDGEFWRERMMEMIRLEKPSAEEIKELKLQFNAGYASAEQRFQACTDEAQKFASSTARQGEDIAQGLANAIIVPAAVAPG
jgi:uncharacterized protein (TIGR02301 family)